MLKKAFLILSPILLLIVVGSHSYNLNAQNADITAAGGGVSLSNTNIWTALQSFTGFAIQPQAGIDFNVNSATLGFITNAFGAARITFSNQGTIIASTTTAGTREIIVNAAKTLSEGVATAFVQIPVSSNIVAGGSVEYTIRADDGIDFQARSGILIYSAVNKGGVETCTLGRADGGTVVDNTTDIVALSLGTLTNTFTCNTSPTNAINIEANATSSLTQTTLHIIYQATKNGVSTGAITPQ